MLRSRRVLATLSALVLVSAACAAAGGEQAGSADPPPASTQHLPADAPPPSAAPATTSALESDDSTTADGGDATVQACADVIDTQIQPLGDGTFRVDATVRSGDTGWDKYADAWEIRTPTGDVLGVRVLAHPHENEQPFTRSLSPVEIDPAVEEVVLAARDSVNGFCGETLTVSVPR